MTTLHINHPVAYPIVVGHDLTIPVHNGPCCVLYDLKVEAYAKQLMAHLGTTNAIPLEGGEYAKTPQVFAQVLSSMAEMRLPRNAMLYVVGGGTITDLGGYVAASYLRGIDFISIPTTTLAMVDASVGGKTGINLPEGKNLVGAFYFPKGVYAELDNLSTLPTQLFKEGLVEAYKHGIIDGDAELLRVQELNINNPATLEPYIARAIGTKIRVVEQDPTEKNERRKLNLGHTLGHALESATKHAVSHGAAIAYGMLYISQVAKQLGGQDQTAKTLELLRWVNPQPLPELSWDTLLTYIARDKKSIGSNVHWVVPMGFGQLDIVTLEGELLEESYHIFLETLHQQGLLQTAPQHTNPKSNVLLNQFLDNILDTSNPTQFHPTSSLFSSQCDEPSSINEPSEEAIAQAWSKLHNIFNTNQTIDIIATEKVKGGLVVIIEGVRAFLPASQVDLKRTPNLESYIGQTLQVNIIEISRKKNRVILSRRALLEAEKSTSRNDALSKLLPGTETEGQVVEITDFGVFVALEGIDGLVHRNEISWGRFNHPSDLVAQGDTVKATVLSVDDNRKRVHLSIKALLPDPWTNAEARFAVGSKISGKVVGLTQAGIFVEVESGLEGLVHVSELSWTKRPKHPSKIASEGDHIEVVVLHVDREKRRLSLSLKQTQPNPWHDLVHQYPSLTPVKGAVTGATEFGVFVEILPGVEGLIHVSELDWNHVEKPYVMFKKGDQVEAVILEIDATEQRISLSRKKLLPAPTKSPQSATPTSKDWLSDLFSDLE